MSVGIPPPTSRECRHLSARLGDFCMDLAMNHSQCPDENSTQGSDSIPQRGGLEWPLPSLPSYWQLVATMMSLSSDEGVAGCTDGSNPPPSGGSMQRLMAFLVSVAMAEKRLGVPVAHEAEKSDECPKSQREEEEDIEERRRRHYCYYNYQMFDRRPPYSPLLRAAFHKRKHHHRRHCHFGPKKRTQSEGNSVSSGPINDSLFKVPKLTIRKTKSASPPTSPAEAKNSSSPPTPLTSSIESRGSKALDMDEEMVAASPPRYVGVTSLSYPPTEPPTPLPSTQQLPTIPHYHRNRKSSSGRRSVRSTFPAAGDKLLKCGWTPCGKLISDGGMRDHLLQHFGGQRNEKGLVLCFWRDCWHLRQFFPSSEVASHISLHLPTLPA